MSRFSEALHRSDELEAAAREKGLGASKGFYAVTLAVLSIRHAVLALIEHVVETDFQRRVQ